MYEDMFPDQVDTGLGLGVPGNSDVPGLNDILNAPQPLYALQKALVSSYETDSASKIDGGAFRIESLESALVNLIFTEKSTVLFNDLLADKRPAYSTVEEFSTMDDVGPAHTYLENTLPAAELDQYTRRFAFVKYIGAIGRVSNVILSIRNIVEPRQQEIRAKMLSIKRKGNLVSYFGDENLVSTEFTGVVKSVENGVTSGLVNSGNIIDMEGRRPSLEMFNQGVEQIMSVAGYTDNLRLYIAPHARTQYKNELLRNKRYLVGGDKRSSSVDAELEGMKSNTLITDGGDTPMRVDMFLNPRERRLRLNRAQNAIVASGDKPPAIPTVNEGETGAEANAASKLPAGTYDYAIVAKNNLGHTSAARIIEGVTVAEGEGVKFTLTDGGSSDGQEATCFEVFRRDASSSDIKDYEFLFQVAANGAFWDLNSYMPNTSNMILLEWDPAQVLQYAQLLDATLFPLANVVDGIQWLQRLYGTLLVRNPKRIVVFTNVGTTSWADTETEEELS